MQPGLRAEQHPPHEAAPLLRQRAGPAADLLANPLATPLAGDLVAGLMRRHEVAAERLIGWLRVGIGACVFVTVILASELLHDLAGVSLGIFQRNAWIAALGFLGIGAASIVLAVPQRWRHGYAYLFMALDVGLVLAIVVLALGERDLPGNAVPSAPIAWAIPVVLAVGALRYDVKVQLCAIALLGLGLVGIAAGLEHHLVLDPAAAGRPAWTQLFSMPVNVMRLTLLLLAGAATAFGIVRSRRLLASAVRDAVGRASLSRFLPAEIAPRLAAGDAALRRGRRQRAVIVFVDIRDSTGMAEGMDPEGLSRFFTAFRTRILACVRRHHGFVDKFIGDGALILFGVPDEGGDDAARGLAFAQDLTGIVEAWNESREWPRAIRIGIGIHVGEVFCGIVGDEERMEFTVLGDAVNVASRLEQATKRYGAAVLASEAAVAGSSDPGAWREVGREPLAGRTQAIAIFAPAVPLAAEPGRPG
ncbi:MULTISPECIES: adenylate/guanylate cyclase domain-containing protein [Methylobacterium]|uniref:adenylate/guanylate cyclase domain-containing protein n=1 Tax=Methylobacterium TaxID=407 RepID=UPI0013ED8085|nr:adenylate/guanylate cyclase domain-containing protein [Methylobacterium sp. DB0501]NGM34637.1 adenylate/guanylate cyclase domain-containing protein [Methylobacterium sp. DB0501]